MTEPNKYREQRVNDDDYDDDDDDGYLYYKPNAVAQIFRAIFSFYGAVIALIVCWTVVRITTGTKLF